MTETKIFGVVPYVLYMQYEQYKAHINIMNMYMKNVGNTALGNLDSGIYNLVFTDTQIIITDAKDDISAIMSGKLRDIEQASDSSKFLQNYGTNVVFDVMFYEKLIEKLSKDQNKRSIITDPNTTANYLSKKICSLDYSDIKKVVVHTGNRIINFTMQNGAPLVLWYDAKILFSKVNFNDQFVGFLKSLPIADRLSLSFI